MSEQTRAAEYRRMMRARAKSKRNAEKALAGDASRKAALEAKTDALRSIDDDGVIRGDLQ